MSNTKSDDESPTAKSNELGTFYTKSISRASHSNHGWRSIVSNTSLQAESMMQKTSAEFSKLNFIHGSEASEYDHGKIPQGVC